MERVKSMLASMMCFIFGHVYYTEGKFTGEFIRVGGYVPRIIPRFEIERPDICPRCGKALQPKSRLRIEKKG
ncbi:MAG: hypothetical protein NUV31_11385 [Dehalococcoidales bacterium]|jgi:hypothetical protein|nr:hypothetical protein [Dehalococcoidales bacterium]